MMNLMKWLILVIGGKTLLICQALYSTLTISLTSSLYSTFSSIFHQNESSVDTGPLRSAMWYYALKLFGVTKDDYDYSDISTYLTNQNKAYIQKVCYTPQEIRYHDWKNFGLSLRDEEKCHVNLLAVQAKKQATLIYGLSVISQI